MTTQSLALLTATDYHELPHEERLRVRAWVAALESVKEAAGITAELTRVAGELGSTFGTVRRKWDGWNAAGRDWRVLADGRKLGRAAEGSLASSREFTDFFKKLCEENQRSTAAAIRALKRRWQARLPIPGYDDFPGWPELPHGWTERNLRRYAPKQGDLIIARKGLKAAASEMALVLRTRVGLWPGSHIQCDDVWHDHFVRFGNEVVRVLEFGALDVWSGSRFAWGSRPRRKKASGGHEGLSERDFRLFVAGFLWGHGYSPRGTVLMLEKGTAALREGMKRRLHELTRGLIDVKEGAMSGETQALKGMWGGRRGGSGNWKSHLESLHNLLHNEMACLPGQIGKDRQNAKESTHGVVRYQERLLMWAESAPRHVAEALRHPLMDYHGEFCPVRDYFYRQIDERTDHDLEGWEDPALRRIVTRYTLAPGSGLWVDLDEIPEEARPLVMSAAAGAPERWTRRHRMSPAEVWRNGRGELVRADHAMVADLIGPDLARERKVSGSYIEFEDAEVSAGTLVYEARVVTPQGRERELPRGERYGMLVNPFEPSALLVLDAKGRCLGHAAQVRRVCLADESALERAMGRKNERNAQLLEPMRGRWADEEAATVELRRHNAALGYEGEGARKLDGGRREWLETQEEAAAEGRAAAALAWTEDDEGLESPYLT